jgi:hypothetical protein
VGDPVDLDDVVAWGQRIHVSFLNGGAGHTCTMRWRAGKFDRPTMFLGRRSWWGLIAAAGADQAARRCVPLAAGDHEGTPPRGLCAAEAKGSKGGRRPAVTAAKTDTVRTAYLEGRSIAPLARDHGVSRGAIRMAVAGLLPDQTVIEKDVPAPELPVTLDMPGKVADFLRTADLEPAEPAERAALDQGATVRYRVTKVS